MMENPRPEEENIVKDIEIFLKNKKKKSDNMVMNVTKISQNIKRKSLLSIEKNIRMRK